MKEDQETEQEYPHWNRVYLIVVLYSIAIMVGLWLFSRMYD